MTRRIEDVAIYWSPSGSPSTALPGELGMLPEVLGELYDTIAADRAGLRAEPHATPLDVLQGVRRN